jgi:hypothetical protein
MALSASRNTKQLGVVKAVLDDLELGQATNTTIYQGALVALNSSGYATPGATAATLIAAGVYMGNPNTGSSVSTGISDGVVRIRVRQGVFHFLNSAAADAIAVGQIGKYCWIVDDQTVAKSSNSGARSIAGIVIAVDSTGVWVSVGLQTNPSVAAGAT